MTDTTEIDWLAPVLVHVQTSLGEDLALTALADMAGYSPHHFQRRFTEAIGESPQQYVERLRMERAGHLLFATGDQASHIAERVGYSRYETFSRAFTRRFGLSPRRYRSNPVRLDGAKRLLPPPGSADIVSMSAVRIEQRRPIPLGFIRTLGDYYKVDPGLYEQLIEWRLAHWPADPSFVLLGIGHDDPGVTETAQLRFDACITVPKPFNSDRTAAFQRFPEGIYAAITYHGPVGEPMMSAYQALYAHVQSSRRYKLKSLPVVEVYNSTQVTAWSSVSTTDILVPVELP